MSNNTLSISGMQEFEDYGAMGSSAEEQKDREREKEVMSDDCGMTLNGVVSRRSFVWAFGCKSRVNRRQIIISDDRRLIVREIGSDAWSDSPLHSMVIPRMAEILHSWCFTRCRKF
jgi:hypothetical protein